MCAERMMETDNKIPFYTFGYGNRVKEEWQQFVDRIKTDGLYVFDVRMTARAWCFMWGGPALDKSLNDEAQTRYCHIPEWGNPDKPQLSIADWDDGLSYFEIASSEYVWWLSGETSPNAIVLLCCEKDPGTLEEPKCHRMLIAKKLIELGYEYLGELNV